MAELQETLVPYEEMLKAGMHFGRRKAVFNPGMNRYVFTVRDGICIIDLLKTQDELQKALEFLGGIIKNGGLVLFAAVTKQSQDAVAELAQAVGMPYVKDRWIGGTLTNFKNINGRVKKLQEMEDAAASGGLDKYTKKERVSMDKTTKTMQKSFQGLKKLTRMPDALFISSLKDGQMAIREALKMGVPVVSIANTDANPRGIAHVIPANDRSKRSVDLILETMKRELAALIQQ